MSDNDSSKLIERYLPEGTSIAVELGLLSKHDEEKRSIFYRRLRAVDQYLSKSDPSVSDVDEAAAQVGVSRRQFYRLLTKVRALGPVRGLLPGLQNVARSSVATEGLDEPIEAILIQEMKRDPAIKIAQLESLVVARSDELGFDRPSEWKLRRRIHALRASGIVGSNIEFGRSLVVDQIAVDLPVRDRGAAYYAGVTLIIDRNTRLIAGGSVTVGDGIGLGIGQALADMSRRKVDFSTSGIPVATKLERLTWVVPPGLERHASEASGRVDARGRKIAAEVVDRGARRHGELIQRLLGDRLGIYHFRTRSELGVDAEVAPEGSIDDVEFASRVIRHCIDSWNKRLMQGRIRASSASDKRTLRRLDRITKELEAYFDPVLTSVENSFRPDHV